MANPIKDALVLELAARHIKPNEKWTSEHHALLLWDWFRHQDFMKDAKPEAVGKMAGEFIAFANNASIAYASNQAKRLADAGICAATQEAVTKLEFK